MARIKKNITKPHLIRVESNTINGIPDINGCWSGKEFWLELKSDKVGYPKLSKWQIAWINKRIKHGGIVIICNETLSERAVQLYRPLSAITDARLLKPRCSFSFPVHWPSFQEALWELLVLVTKVNESLKWNCIREACAARTCLVSDSRLFSFSGANFYIIVFR